LVTDGFTKFGFGEDPPEVSLPEPTGNLTVELVPSTSWGANLRSELSSSDWNKLRRQAYKLAGYRCEVCGGKGRQHPVECHEIWEYDDDKHVQKLTGLVALCPPCHQVKHFGRTDAIGRGPQALLHLQRVNDWDRHRAANYVMDAFAQWQNRSQHEWTLNLTWLEQHGVEVPTGPQGEFNQDPEWED
jgi:hypothetical protein